MAWHLRSHLSRSSPSLTSAPPQEGGVLERLSAQGLTDLPRLLADIKESGDVRLFACSSSMAICGVKAEDLLDGIEVRGLTAFLLEDVAAADKVLTF